LLFLEQGSPLPGLADPPGSQYRLKCSELPHQPGDTPAQSADSVHSRKRAVAQSATTHELKPKLPKKGMINLFVFTSGVVHSYMVYISIYMSI
jgi:hypothetical protein